MGFQQRLTKAVSAVSCQLLEHVRSSLHVNIRMAVPIGPTLQSQTSQNVVQTNMIANLSQIQLSQFAAHEQNKQLLFYEHKAMLPQFVFGCQRQNFLPLLSNFSNPSSNGGNVRLSFSRQSEAEAYFHIPYSSPSWSARSSNFVTSVFQCSSPQGSFRIGCSKNIITCRALSRHQPLHSIAYRMKHTKPKVPPTKIARVYDYEGTITDEQAAEEFVFALKASERQHLYAELSKYQGLKANGGSQASPPTRKQLQQVVLHQTFPFLGFGFLDNLLMIVAGEYIDVTLGAAFGISTMAAAALGNLISDVGGLGSAHYVETLAAKVGVRNPHLSPEQVDMRRTKWASNLGKFIGVTLGCLLGMFPLLFFNDKKAEGKDEDSQKTREKSEEKVVEDAKNSPKPA